MNLSTGNLEADWQKRSVSPSDLAQLARRNIIPLIALPLIYLLAGFFYIIYATPIYTATATIEFLLDETDPAILDASMTSHMASIRAPEATSEVIDRFGFDTSSPLASGRLNRTIQSIRAWLGTASIPELTPEEERAIVVDLVAQSLVVERYGESSTIVNVTYYALEPRLAAEVANAYVDIYLERLRERSRESAARRATFIEGRIADVQEQASASLQDVQRIRSEAMESGGFENLDVRLARLTESRAGIDEQVVALTTRLTLLEPGDDIEALEEAALQFEGGLQLVNAYANALQTLERFRDRNSSNDAISAMEASANLLREDVMRAFARERSRLQQELKVLQARRDNIDTEIANALFEGSRRNWSQILIEEHQAGVFQNIYADYLRELEAVYAGAEATPLRIMAHAQARFNPDSPNYKLVLILSLFLGIVFGIGVSVVREWQRSQRQAVLTLRSEMR